MIDVLIWIVLALQTMAVTGYPILFGLTLLAFILHTFRMVGRRVPRR